MNIELHKITVRELTQGYVDNNENGVRAYGGRLDVRPSYQREFVYKEKQRDAVIDTLTQGFPLNVMYWAVVDDASERRDDNGATLGSVASYEIIDGQQRTISICQYVHSDFAFNFRYFHNLQPDEQEQILNYELQIYICSGTDRFMCRELVSGVLPIADNHFIGMDVMLKARGQGNTDGLEYVYAKDDQVVRTDELLIKSVKMNKVSLLSRELGKAPVLCFGNSSGDESMAAYTTQNEKYLSKAFLLVADDDVRDYGSVEKGAQKAEKWRSKGWEVISMKNDWTTIYGGNVVKTSK